MMTSVTLLLSATEAHVTINGTTLTVPPAWVSVSRQSGQAPRVVLEMPVDEVAVELPDCVTEQVVHENGSDSVVRFLQSVDPGIVQAQALGTMGFGESRSTTEAIIGRLIEMAGEGQ